MSDLNLDAIEAHELARIDGGEQGISESDYQSRTILALVAEVKRLRDSLTTYKAEARGALVLRDEARAKLAEVERERDDLLAENERLTMKAGAAVQEAIEWRAVVRNRSVTDIMGARDAVEARLAAALKLCDKADLVPGRFVSVGDLRAALTVPGVTVQPDEDQP